MIIALLSTLGVLILSLIVFGGGQVFMPLFKILWQLMDKHGAHISETQINNIFVVSNSTPGVVSTKFGLFTGYLVSNGAWWGYLAMIGTYLIFALPSILLIMLATKMVKKTKTNPYLKNTVMFLRPVIIGVLASLSVQLLIGTMFPQLSFNAFGNYNPHIKDIAINTKQGFFVGWRMWTLIAWFPIATILSVLYLYKKKPILLLIFIYILISLLIFWPWQ
ncbi:MAG: chromate transporter [Mycoplasma sp.]|nr:chromate transporter [Mycoplasma sp.]